MVLQGVSVLTFVWAREWQPKDILNDIDGLMWEDSPEKMGKSSCQREAKVLPCEVRHWASRGTRANDPNRCATEISVCLIKSSKKKLRAPLCSEVSFEVCWM